MLRSRYHLLMIEYVGRVYTQYCTVVGPAGMPARTTVAPGRPESPNARIGPNGPKPAKDV